MGWAATSDRTGSIGWVERLGAKLLPSHYATALGNLFRRKGRLILTQLVLVSAGTMFLLVMTLSTSITYTLDEVFQRRGFDVTISFRERQREERIAEIAAATDGVEARELMAHLFRFDCCAMANAPKKPAWARSWSACRSTAISTMK